MISPGQSIDAIGDGFHGGCYNKDKLLYFELNTLALGLFTNPRLTLTQYGDNIRIA